MPVLIAATAALISAALMYRTCCHMEEDFAPRRTGAKSVAVVETKKNSPVTSVIEPPAASVMEPLVPTGAAVTVAEATQPPPPSPPSPPTSTADVVAPVFTNNNTSSTTTTTTTDPALKPVDELSAAYTRDVRADASLTPAQSDMAVRILLHVHELHERRPFDGLLSERAVVGVVLNALRKTGFQEAKTRALHMDSWIAFYAILRRKTASAKRDGTEFPADWQSYVSHAFAATTPTPRDTAVPPRAPGVPEPTASDAIFQSYLEKLSRHTELAWNDKLVASDILLALHQKNQGASFIALPDPDAVVRVVARAVARLGAKKAFVKVVRQWFSSYMHIGGVLKDVPVEEWTPFEVQYLLMLSRQ